MVALIPAVATIEEESEDDFGNLTLKPRPQTGNKGTTFSRRAASHAFNTKQTHSHQ